MPITKTMAYKVGDDVYHTLEDAQVAAINDLLKQGSNPEHMPGGTNEIVRSLVRDHANDVVKILTGDAEYEKPARKPRSDKGKKRAKAESVQA